MIEAWRKANPQQRFVTSVRFDDVAILRGRNEISHALSDSIGLLAPIDQAVREAQGIRLLAERGAYIMQHIPPLLLAQARYVVHEQVSPEQMDGLVRDFSALSGSVADAQKAFAGLPQFITKEREALLHEWDKRQDSLAALLASTAPVFEAGKGMSADLRETLAMLEKLLQSYEKSGTVINDTIERSQALVRYMDSTPPFDPTKLLATLDALIRLGQEIDHLAARLQTTAGQNLELAVFGSYERLLNAFFWRLLLLVAAILALILIYRYLSQRYLGGSPRSEPIMNPGGDRAVRLFGLLLVLAVPGATPQAGMAPRRRRLGWMAVGLLSHNGQLPARHDIAERVHPPAPFARLVYERLQPGATLMVTDRPAMPQIRTQRAFGSWPTPKAPDG